MFEIGQWGLISLVSHFLFIYITWKIMLGINFDPIVRKGRATEGRLFLIFIAIVVGSGVSRFVLDIIQWSSSLVYLF